MRVKLTVPPNTSTQNKVLALVCEPVEGKQLAVALSLPEWFDEELFMSRARNAFATLKAELEKGK